ncbi:MAG: DNA recombination protein RmuC [Muribaculaceae bacterium]|nr:DNA recombination protein RmuC [Muribaculaceae bacterium]
MNTIIMGIAGMLVAVVLIIYFNRQMQRIRKDYESQSLAKDSNAERLLAQQRSEMEQRIAAQQREMENRLAMRQREMEARMRQQAADAEQQSRVYFKNIAEEVLHKQSESLKMQNNEMMTLALDPVKTKLDEFAKAVSDSYVRETADRKSLADQIERLMKLNSDIGKEARNLTTALKGDSKVQGDWGEMVLQTLLESAGMVEGQNFFTQVTRDEGNRILTDETGNRLRPDVVVNLPDNHKMVIDSKVSLKAYTEYMSASDDEERETAGKRHIRSVMNHIDELGDKKYQIHINKAADHIMMFIPNEGAYYAAMQLNPDLWKYAYDRNVVIVSPTHLFSVMQIVAQLWQQDRQNKYAMEIAKAGGELYDKFVDYYNDMAKVEKSMHDVMKNFDRCRQDVENRVGIMAKAKKLRELGANATKHLPEKF